MSPAAAAATDAYTDTGRVHAGDGETGAETENLVGATDMEMAD